MTEETGLRRKPRQARSQQRVDNLLDTAARLFAAESYEQVTTNAIATRAGIPIGSLYQFFPNKEAILEALVVRYTSQLQELYVETLSPQAVEALHITQIIDQFVERFAEFESRHDGFRAVFLMSNTPMLVSTAAQSIHQHVIQVVENLITARFPQLPLEQRRLTAVVSVGIVKGVMPLGAPPDHLPQQQVLDELKLTLLAYLRSVLVRAALPLPPDLA